MTAVSRPTGAPDLTGLAVALATPFAGPAVPTEAATKPAPPGPEGTPPPGAPGEAVTVDLEGFGRLLDHVIAGGVDSVVVLGSTGEAATVADDERAALVRAARARLDRPDADGIALVVGVGHNDTVRTCELAAAAVRDGADALLVVTPYYNKPQPRGLQAHYRAVADAAPGTPIIAYNVPGRTGTTITPETMALLWQVEQVVGLKDSGGDLRATARLCQEAPAGRFVLAGDDDLALASIAVGAQGLVSVCANLDPARTAALVRAARAGDLAAAQRTNRALAPLMDAMFVETNPVPVKVGLACLGLAGSAVRAPLAPAEPETWAQVLHATAGLGMTGVVRLPDAAADGSPLPVAS